MIAFLNGKIVEKKDTAVVIDVNGVGYEVFCSPRTVAALPDGGGACHLHVQAQYRADSATLFGFASSQEKSLFLSLIKVDSVGPKSALNIMAAAPWDEIVQLIEEGDVSGLAKLPKISKKTAEHLVVKLKGKLGEILIEAGGVTGHAESPRPTRGSAIRKMRSEAQTALAHLGFRPQDIEKTLEELSDEAWTGELQDVIRHALTHLSGNA